MLSHSPREHVTLVPKPLVIFWFFSHLRISHFIDLSAQVEPGKKYEANEQGRKERKNQGRRDGREGVREEGRNQEGRENRTTGKPTYRHR